MTRRRTVLRGLAGAGLASVAPLTGCTGLPSGGTSQTELPSYHRYVPAEEAGSKGSFFATIDVARLREFEDDALEDDFPGSDEGQGGMGDPDPLLAYPSAGLLVVAFGVSFGLVPYGFSAVISKGLSDTPLESEALTPDAGGGETGTPDDATRVDSMLIQPEAIVLSGSFDAETLADAARGFEHAGRRAGFEVYEGDGDSLFDTGNLAFAVDGETVIALVGEDGGEPRSRLDGVIDVASGDADRLSADGDADWALRTAGHGFTTFGGWGVDPDEVDPAEEEPEGRFRVESALDRAHGLVSSLSYDSAAETLGATVAAVFPEGETPDRATLSDQLGPSASEREIEVDGTRVSVTATWTDDETTES